MTLEGRLALKEKVFHWLKEGLIRKVQYPEWIANTIPIKLPSGTWKVKVDYSSINKVCAKDMYPLPEEGEELASLIGYPYKCFLRLPKEYIQIRMAEGDEEKTGFHTEEGTNEAEEGLRRIKRKVRKLQTFAILKEGEDLMLFFRKHKVKVVTDGSMDETLKLARREGQLGKWATEIRTYDISYVQRNEAEGSVVKKFFGQGEQVEETPNANKGGIFNLSRETIEEGSGVGIILISPKEKMYSYDIQLKFKASNHAMDCEALLAGLAASANQGMKDLHVFIDSLTLVTQVEGNHTPATEQERRHKEEIMDAAVPFHRFRITHLPKILNLKAEVLTGLETIKVEFLNQEVSVGIKTRPSVEETSSNKKGKATSKALGAKPNCNYEVSGSN
ncbi:reverse transcriptase domain-containing protein [Tanacetum coccineum]